MGSLAAWASPEDGADRDAGQHQDADGVHTPVTDQPGRDAQGRDTSCHDESPVRNCGLAQ